MYFKGRTNVKSWRRSCE